MPLRRVTATVRADSSDLSPPPAELSFVPTATNGKKRKRGTVKVEETTTELPLKATTPAAVGTDGTTVTSTKRRRVQTTNGAHVKGETTTTVTTPRGRKRKVVKNEEPDADPHAEARPDAAPLEKSVKVEETSTTVTTTKKRKTKADKAAEAMPLAARTVGHKYFLGAHVSSSGGVHNSVTNAVHIGANSFALFLKSQRQWASKPLEPEARDGFVSGCASHGIAAGAHVLPHGSYLVNLAHPDPARTAQAYDAFLDDLRRCEALGIRLYNFHPGSVQGCSRDEAIKQLARNLNRAHQETKGVVTLLENMAAAGNTIGGTWEDIGQTIELIEDKSRIGFCLDTCHAFAAGYDLSSKRSLEASLEEMDTTVGLKYLKALHLNDSKAPLNSRRDLHANIGTGFLGLRAFHAIMNEPRFEGLPIVLETPIDVYDSEGNAVKDDKGKANKEDKDIWAREIKMLESLHGMDVDSIEFKALEQELAAKGQKERARIQDQVDRKAVKDASPKKKRKKKSDTSDEESG